MKFKIFSLDGGFSIDPFLNLKSSLEISPDMWNKNNIKRSKQENFYKMFFYNNNINYHKLYIDGYNDARLNNDSIYACLNDNF